MPRIDTGTSQRHLNRRLGPKSVLFSILLTAMGCAVNPETGRNQFIVLGEQREIAIGEQAAPNFLKDYGGAIPSEPIQDYVGQIGMNLARKSKRPLLPWEFHVVDSSVMNAFAIPGGKVFITRGLLAKFDNEAQLAGVLGHEIAHLSARHINEQMAQALLIQILTFGIGTATRQSDEQWLRVLGVGTQIGGTVFLLQYSRKHEYQADGIGIRYMTRCGYHPSGQVQVMEILRNERHVAGRQPQLLSTHPLPQQRVERLKGLIEKRYSQEQLSSFKFHAEQFEALVRPELAKLPPPKHQKSEDRNQRSEVRGQRS